jgi:uncharacterized protein (DUF697 family)
MPNVSQSKIDDLADVFLIGTSVKDLNATEQAQARNVTRSIFVVQQGNRNVTMNLRNNVAVQPNATGGAINAVRMTSWCFSGQAKFANGGLADGRRANDSYAVQHDRRGGL